MGFSHGDGGGGGCEEVVNELRLCFQSLLVGGDVK